MLQIIVLYLSALKVKMYFTFMLHVNGIIDHCAVIGEKFSYYVSQFKTAFNKLNQIFLKYDPMFFTEQLQQANTNRAYEFRRLREMIRYLSLYADTEEMKLAAGRLLKITDLYGGSSIPDQNMSAMTASITNLIEDFEDKHQSEIELLGLTNLLDSLKQAEQEYDRIYLERVEFDAESGKDVMDAARRVMDTAYRDLVTIVNLGAKRDAEGELSEFINMMNVEIGRYRTYTGQGQVEGSTGAGTDTDTVRMRTARFEFEGGRIETVTAEVGSVLTAPANTTGWKWDPEVPEFMPDRNTTFREIPVSSAMATATFHFFDHREEEIRQLVGSILNAPTNTVGYYWDPTVPATMPAEDTAYYELPDAEQQPTLYKIDFIHGGETVASYDLEAGARVAAPTPPTGYRWVDVPATMPARNVTIYSELDDELPPSLE